MTFLKLLLDRFPSSEVGWRFPDQGNDRASELFQAKTKRKVFIENTTIHLRKNLVFFRNFSSAYSEGRANWAQKWWKYALLWFAQAGIVRYPYEGTLNGRRRSEDSKLHLQLRKNISSEKPAKESTYHTVLFLFVCQLTAWLLNMIMTNLNDKSIWGASA